MAQKLTHTGIDKHLERFARAVEFVLDKAGPYVESGLLKVIGRCGRIFDDSDHDMRAACNQRRRHTDPHAYRDVLDCDLVESSSQS
ncbi:MAG TPA: hypothetical protein VLF67_03400 [Candidatus Saccharimonas sp.]|nr:hypothetical protein [Candidatus Saccharimonas sp.]